MSLYITCLYGLNNTGPICTGNVCAKLQAFLYYCSRGSMGYNRVHSQYKVLPLA